MRLLLFMTLVTLCVAAYADAGELTLERIFADPSLDGTEPRALKIAPDGSRVTFLRGSNENQQRLDLWEYAIDSGHTRLLVSADELAPAEAELSDEEKARRERQRIAQFTGIIDYSWTGNSEALLFPLNGDLYLYRLADGESRRLTEDDAFETDARLSPGGAFVSFVRNYDLHVIELESGEERALTTGGTADVSHGTAEFVAQEEMSRNTGYWWSPDERYVAFLQVDNRPVNKETRHEVYGSEVKVIEQRYPSAGTPNAVLKLGVVDLEKDAIRWLDLGDNKDVYIPRVTWFNDSRRLAVQRQSRNQQSLELLAFDVVTGGSTVLLTEQSTTFLNLHDDLRFLQNSDLFTWTSEKSGFRHLYLHDLEGQEVRQLTRGDWEVTRLEAVNEERGWVYFTATKESPGERHLYRVSVQGGEPETLTDESGTHTITMPPGGNLVIDSFSSRVQPTRVSVHDENGKHLAWLSENRLSGEHPYVPYLSAHGSTEFGTLPASDGQDLHWQLSRPADFDPDRRYPVIVHVYGGPTGQMVVNAWSRRILVEQYWLQRGFLVFTLDNRGVEHYGKAFQDPAYKKLGQIEVEDQLAGVEWLSQQDFVDAERIGVFGWSYGGYMTLMMLMQHPGVFAAGVAVAPVTDWSLYDTHYTERYMGTPQGDPEVYVAGNVLTYAGQLSDPLLLVHGMADDNVLFTHSTVLMEKLQKAPIAFDLMTYPGGKHGLVGEQVQVHVFRTISDFFTRHLQD